MRNSNTPNKTPLFHPAAIALLGLAGGSLIIVIIARLNTAFADFFNRYISAFARFFLAKLSNVFPFSLAEMLIVLSPMICVGLIVYAIKKKSKTWKQVLSFSISLLSAVSIIFSLFVWSFGCGYYTPTLDRKMGLSATAVSAKELKSTADWLSLELVRLHPMVYFGSDGFSIMPYSLETMNKKLMDAYDSVVEKYGFLQKLNSNIKPVMGSVAMSYAHLTGVYTFFTGEANLNVDFPDYTLAYTAAHEFAHQRGISRENEANFVAFLVCAESDDVYLQYCGYLNLYEYVVSALYSADREAYRQSLKELPPCVLEEIYAYSRFYDKYRDSKAGEVNNAVNNTFLQANGEKEGTKSYGMVVDLAVAFHKSKNK